MKIRRGWALPLRDVGKGFSSANPILRNRLERWDGIQRFKENINAQTRSSDEFVLETASWFIPAGQLTKLRYLKFAVKLFESKRGIPVLKFGGNLTMESLVKM